MELALCSSVVQFFMKEGQFQHRITKMPPKVLKIYCFRWLLLTGEITEIILQLIQKLSTDDE
jgi:hypothetical protein